MTKTRVIVERHYVERVETETDTGNINGIDYLSTREMATKALHDMADGTPAADKVLLSTAIRLADRNALVLEWDAQGRSRHDEREEMR